MRKNRDPKRELPIEADQIIEVIKDIADEGHLYEDMYISRNTFINFMWASSRGIYVFVSFDDDKDEIDLLLQAKEIKGYFPVLMDGLFIFFLSEDQNYIAEKNLKSLKKLEDPLISFSNIVKNLSRPAVLSGYTNKWSLDYLVQDNDPYFDKDSEENGIHGMVYEHEGAVFQIEDEEEEETEEETMGYVRPVVDSSTLDALDAICEKIVGNDYPDADYKVDEEGNEYVLKDGDVMVKGFNTGFIGNKRWYRVSERDPYQAFAITVFGGWFGLHRLATGSLAAFLFYLLTCGCAGVFYILDVLQWVIGSASYAEVNYYEQNDGTMGKPKLIREKSKVYYKKIKNPAVTLGGLALSIVIILLSFNFIYKPAIRFASSAIPKKTVEDYSEEDLQKFEELQNKDFSALTDINNFLK